MIKQSKKSNLVRRYICNLIDNGLRCGDLLPSVSDISAELQISRMTVLRTLRRMEKEGIVECRKRSGTFVGKFMLFQSTAPAFAGKMRSRRKKVITFFSPEPHESEFVKDIFDGASAVLEDDFTIIKHHYHVDKSHEGEEFSKALASSDGILLIPSYPAELRFMIHQALNNRYPLVFVDRYMDDMCCNYVGVNNTEAIFTVMNRLYDSGHREIGFYCVEPEHYFAYSSAKMRYEAYQLFMKQKKLSPFLFKSPGAVVAHWQKQYRNQISALVCNNDKMAYDLCRVLQEAKIRVPEDISLTGIDDLVPGPEDQIKVTSIRQPKFSIGLQGALLLKELLEHPDEDSCYTKILLNGEIVNGNTVSPYNKEK